MKITREQAIKWNKQAQGGFRFDTNYYLTHGEKTLVKYVKLNDDVVIEFRIWFMPEYERKSNEHCSWNAQTGRQIPELWINLLRHTGTGDMYNSVPISRGIPMGEPEKTKKYSTLCRISGEYDAEKFAQEWAAANLENVDDIPKYSILF